MANLLTDDVDGAVYDGTAHNNNNTQIAGSFEDLGPYVISGLAVTIGVGLSVAVALGVAFIGGRVTKSAGFTIGGLTNGATNFLYLLQDGTTTANVSGTQPSLSVLLGKAVTAAGAVSSVDTTRSSGRQTKVRTENLVPGGPGAGNPASIDLSLWAAAAANGVTVFGTLPGGSMAANVFLKDSDQTLSDGTDIAVGSTNGTKIGTATSQKLGFYNATPVVQPVGTTDLRQALINLGLYATGGASPLNLNGGALTASGSNSLGATTLTGDLTLSTHNLITDTSTGSQIGTGSTQKLGFYGATPVAQRGNTTDLRQALIDLGFLATGGASPLNLNGGQLTAGVSRFSGVVGGDDTGAGTAFQIKSATVTPPSDADYTLTAAEMSCMLLTVVAGSWTSGHNIIVPTAAGGTWEFSNSSGFTMTVKTAAGTGIAIANGRAAQIRSNGVNCRRRTADVDPTV